MPHSPRAILQAPGRARARARASASTWRPSSSSTCSTSRTRAPAQKVYKNLKTAGWYIEDYHILQTTKEEGLIRAIRNGMDAAGIPVEFSKGEWGPGQAELNLRYAEAVEMADRHAIYKNGVKEIAHLQGKCRDLHGQMGLRPRRQQLPHPHARSSTPRAARRCSRTSDGQSELFRRYLAGQLALARDMTFFLAPYINSYKRFQAGSFAPTKAIWSGDNRTAGFRVLGARRRRCGSSAASRAPTPTRTSPTPRCSPPACTASSSELELEPAFSGDAYKGKDIREVPKTLREALECLDRSQVLRAAFGDAGGRALPARRPLGAVRVRPPGDRPRADPRLRAGLRRWSAGRASPAGPRW